MSSRDTTAPMPPAVRDTTPIEALRRAVCHAVARVSTSSVLRRMGYRRISDANQRRLARVVADPLLGLDAPGFDFRCDASGFAFALCEALTLDAACAAAGLACAQRVVARRRAFDPFLFVDTGFVRTTQSALALAAMEGHRRIGFARAFRDLAPIAQIRAAGARAREHCLAHDGVLPLWGTIRGYVLHHAPGKACALDCRGEVVAPEASAIAPAALAFKGRSLAPCFG